MSTIENKQFCILVVEDNKQNLKLIGDLLTDAGYQLSIATNAEQTYSILKLLRPDLIFLDIMLPHSDGYEICRTIKSNPVLKSIPIIINSALYTVEDRIKAFDAGASDFIGKPFYSEEVLKRIAVHIEYSKLVHKNPHKSDHMTQNESLSHSLEQAISIIEAHLPHLDDPLVTLKLKGVTAELKSTKNTLQ